jgi:hypothetical protein
MANAAYGACSPLSVEVQWGPAFQPRAVDSF